MKLAGPKPHVRFVLGLHGTQAVVTGVFPPEKAPARRAEAASMAIAIDPVLREAWESTKRQIMHQMIYGAPDHRVGRGILS